MEFQNQKSIILNTKTLFKLITCKICMIFKTKTKEKIFTLQIIILDYTE